jgi:hypothetical protein
MGSPTNWRRIIGPVKVIADTSDRCIEDQQVIDKILSHLKIKDRLPSLPNALLEPERHHTNSRSHEANHSFPWLDYFFLTIELKPDSGNREVIVQL